MDSFGVRECLSSTAMRKAEGRGQSEPLVPWRPGLWRFSQARRAGVLVGVADRSITLEALQGQLRANHGIVLAEQIHGASLAVVESGQPAVNPIPGCDGLITRAPGVVLVIRTADCLPIVAWDPTQPVVGLIHAGWRGLAAHLPMRLVSGFWSYAQSQARDLWVGIGPAIRACCYDVGPDFAASFGPFLQEREGRRTCDLIACAIEQLVASGVPRSHILDSGQCTACDTTRWYSVRQEGETPGRLCSFVRIRP